MKRLIESWTHQAATQIATFSVLIGTYSTIFLGGVIFKNIHAILTTWGEEVRLDVYLKDDIKPEETERLREKITHESIVKNIQYISKDQAAHEFKKKMASYAPGLLEDDEFENPLPASFETTLVQGVDSARAFSGLVEFAKEIKSMVGVEDVSYGQGWVENYASVLRIFVLSSYVLLFVLLMGSLLVIGNSIRGVISARRDEIEILELFGATRFQIQRPFLVEGASLGLAASAIAMLAVYFFFQWQTNLIKDQLSFWQFSARFEFLSWLQISGSIIVGTLLGGLGSYLSVSQIATGFAAAEAKRR